MLECAGAGSWFLFCWSNMRPRKNSRVPQGQQQFLGRISILESQRSYKVLAYGGRVTPGYRRFARLVASKFRKYIIGSPFEVYTRSLTRFGQVPKTSISAPHALASFIGFCSYRPIRMAPVHHEPHVLSDLLNDGYRNKRCVSRTVRLALIQPSSPTLVSSAP